MIDGLGSILDRVQTLFGKGYLVAGFIPVLLFTLLSLLLLPLVIPEAPFLLQDALELTGEKQALVALCIVLAVSFVAFVVWMMNSWFRQLLEGRIVRPRWFIGWQQEKLIEKEKQIKALHPDLVNYRIQVGEKKWLDALKNASLQASAGSGKGKEVSSDLKEAIKKLRDLSADNRRIAYQPMEKAFKWLQVELGAKQEKELPHLGELHVEFLSLAKDAYEKVEAEFNQLWSERYLQYPLEGGSVEPTTLANVTAAHEDYVYNRYGINIELFWPAFAKSARNDPNFYSTLEDVKIRLDFSVSMAAMSMIFSIAWMVMLLWCKTGRGVFVAIALLGPLAAMIFYRIAVWNAYAFNATVRNAIEMFRFDTLKALHVELPADSAAEKEVWLKITRLAELADGQVTYKHPAP